MSRQTQGNREPQSARDKTYTMGALIKTLGISRGTLRYYEQLGVIDPKRDSESNYRIYSNEDVFRFVDFNMLKNAGYSPQDAQVLLESCGGSDYIDRCLSENRKQRKWHDAQEESLERLREICGERRPFTPRLVVAPVWDIYFDKCEVGYDNIQPDVALDALMRSMPISSFGSVLQGDFFSVEPRLPRWGRAIPERYLDLLPELENSSLKPRRLGGRPCVRMNYAVPADSIPGFDMSYETRRQMGMFLEQNRMAQDDDAFTVRALPIGDTFYAEVYLPVRGIDFASRLKLGRLTNAAKCEK